jgi:hypothetical protein
MLRDPRRRFVRGETVTMRGLRIEVTEVTSDGRPGEMLATFEQPLETEALVWMAWRKSGFVPFTAPAVGQSVTLPSVNFLDAIFGK